MISEDFSNLSDCVISKESGHMGGGVPLHGDVTTLFICCTICCHNLSIQVCAFHAYSFEWLGKFRATEHVTHIPVPGCFTAEAFIDPKETHKNLAVTCYFNICCYFVFGTC